MFHVSHPLCSNKKRARNRSPASVSPLFPQPPTPRRIYAVFLSGRVCYFFRNRIVKAAEKVNPKGAWKSCAKHVENALIFCGFAIESLCKKLWITCGETVE
jgi:hypothetical protein